MTHATASSRSRFVIRQRPALSTVCNTYCCTAGLKATTCAQVRPVFRHMAWCRPEIQRFYNVITMFACPVTRRVKPKCLSVRCPCCRTACCCIWRWRRSMNRGKIQRLQRRYAAPRSESRRCVCLYVCVSQIPGKMCTFACLSTGQTAERAFEDFLRPCDLLAGD